MRILVDLNRCQGYGQCVYFAPQVFRLYGAESLEFDYAPDDSRLGQVRQAAAACPVQAIEIGQPDEPRRPDLPAAGTPLP